jgi:integrase
MQRDSACSHDHVRLTVPLPPELLEELRRIREIQATKRALLGYAYEDRDLVFCQVNGRPLHAHNLSQRDFKHVVRRARVPMVRFHDLRHASVGVTLDVYSHVLPGMHEDAVRTLAARLVGTVR